MPKMCVFRCLISLFFLCTGRRAQNDWVGVVTVLRDILTLFSSLLMESAHSRGILKEARVSVINYHHGFL